MSNETVEYRRRNSGVKKTLVKADTWAVNVADFTADDICPAFTMVDVFADRLHSESAEIKTKSFDDDQKPFVTVSIGGTCAVTVFLSPEQARTLAVSLAETTGMID